jgi:hypothetical protein
MMLSFLSDSTIKVRFGINGLIKLQNHIKDHVIHHTNKQKSLRSSSYRVTRIPSIEAEHWVTDAFNGRHVGNGNSPVDVIIMDNNNKKIGIDVKCLTSNKEILSSKTTTFCSIATLGSKFRCSKSDINDLITRKMDTIKRRFNVDEVLYVFLLTSNTDIGVIFADVTWSKDIMVYQKPTMRKTVYLKGIIDDFEGRSRLDSSGKKIELNLCPMNLPIIKLWSIDTNIIIPNDLVDGNWVLKKWNNIGINISMFGLNGYWQSFTNLFSKTSRADIKTIDAAKTVITEKFFGDIDHINGFFNKLVETEAVIGGKIVLGFLGINIPKEDVLDVYINIFNVNKLVKYLSDRGYNLFYIDGQVVMSESWIYDALNYSCITKICKCNNKYTVDRCTDPKCIKGCIRLNICNGDVNQYVNSVARATYQRLKFNGKEVYDDYLEKTSHFAFY